MSTETKTRITLIHGTFAAKSDWVLGHEDTHQEGFRARLHRQLGENSTFSVPKPWGALGFFNKLWDLTNLARLNGASSLSQHILSQDKVSGEKHFLIAHSHGGNVAMYALQDPKVRERVDGLICMATPFLFPRIRPLSITALLLSLAIMVFGVLQIIGKMSLLEQGWVEWTSAVGLLVTGVAVPMFLVGIVVRERYQRKVSGDPELQDHIERVSYSDPGVPILLIRSSGDEASGLLRGTQFLNWLAGIVMRLGGRQIYALLCASALLLLWMANKGMAWVPDGTFAIMSTALMISAAIMIVMLMVLTVSRVLVGLDAWRWVGELETMIEDGPPGIAADLLVITPRQPKAGLSHTAVYSEPETVDAIARWCNEIGNRHS